jgi:hypothetical protein
VRSVLRNVLIGGSLGLLGGLLASVSFETLLELGGYVPTGFVAADTAAGLAGTPVAFLVGFSVVSLVSFKLLDRFFSRLNPKAMSEQCATKDEH